MKKFLFSIAIIIVFPLSSSGQSIKGFIVDNNNMPLAYCNIQIKAVNTGHILGTISEDNGKFIFNKVDTGNYVLQAFYIGFKPFESTIYVLGNLNLDSIKMENISTTLEQVVITGNRPKILPQIDGFIIPIANTSIANESALEALRYVPGLISKEGKSLIINGQGVTVFINNRKLNLTGDQLVEYLKNINAQNIKTIRVYTNTNSSMDAEGTGGIIKITIGSSSDSNGTSLKFNTSYSQGYTPEAVAGLSLNSNFNKLLIYSLFNYRYNQTYFDKNEFATDLVQSQIKQWKKGSEKNSNNLSLGAIYDLTTNHKVGFEIDANWNTRNNRNKENYSQIYLTKDSILTTTHLLFDSKNKDADFNFNYEWLLDTVNEKKLTFVSDYYISSFKRNESYNSQNLKGEELQNLDYKKNISHNSLDIFTSELTYLHSFRNSSIRVGGKSTLVESVNDNRYFYFHNDEFIPDINRTDKFKYEEKILASFFELNSKYKTLDYKVGLRLENTEYTNKSLTLDSISKRSYTSIFPSFFVKLSIFNDRDYVSCYAGRRLQRPAYEIMNPFEYFEDEYNVKKGNPLLTPQYSISTELKYSLKKKYTFSLSYYYIEDMITDYYYSDVSRYLVVNTFNNLAESELAFASVIVPFSISKWWYTDNYMAYAYKVYQEPGFKNEAPYYLAYSNHTVKFSKSLSLLLNFNFSSKESYGYYKIETNTYRLDVFLKQKLFKDRATLQFFVKDILLMDGKYKGSYNYGNLDSHYKVITDTRRIGLGFSYSLNQSNTYKQNKKSNSDELDRK